MSANTIHSLLSMGIFAPIVQTMSILDSIHDCDQLTSHDVLRRVHYRIERYYPRSGKLFRRPSHRSQGKRSTDEITRLAVARPLGNFGNSAPGFVVRFGLRLALAVFLATSFVPGFDPDGCC